MKGLGASAHFMFPHGTGEHSAHVIKVKVTKNIIFFSSAHFIFPHGTGEWPAITFCTCYKSLVTDILQLLHLNLNIHLFH